MPAAMDAPQQEGLAVKPARDDREPPAVKIALPLHFFIDLGAPALVPWQEFNSSK